MESTRDRLDMVIPDHKWSTKYDPRVQCR